MAKNSVILDNVFVKKRDRFEVGSYWQDDTGIQCYSPADGGTIRGNVVVGFRQGIYAKCRGTFTVEHNTVIASRSALYRSNWHNGNVFRRNIVVDTYQPFHNPKFIEGGTVVTDNLVWQPRELALFHESLDCAILAGNHGNVIADPRFVAPEKGDYRLRPDSPAVKLAAGDRPWGAMPVLDAMEDRDAPTVSISLNSPAAPAGAKGVEFFENDPWNGGERSQVREHLKSDDDVDYVTRDATVHLLIDANDALGELGMMKTRIDAGAWSEGKPFTPRLDVDLGANAGLRVLSVRVSDTAGNWSPPADLRIAVAKVAPVLIGEPTIYTSDHGAVVCFETDRPALAWLVLPSGHHVAQPRMIDRAWDAMVGGDSVTEWTTPRRSHAIALDAAAAPAGADVTYRIELKDGAGLKGVTEERKFKAGGAARTIRVAAGGSIQAAVDIALPGDTVLLEPGLYVQSVYFGRGGVSDAPIALKAAEPGTVTLDGARDLASLIRLEGAPNVVIENLELRWVTLRGYMVYAADSPNLTIRNCRMWNKTLSYEWGEGWGVFAHRSPGLIVDNCLLLRLEHGVVLLDSPHSRITKNTMLQCLYGGLAVYVLSAEGTVVENNCFAFNGNDSIYIEALSPTELETFQCDYNNLGTQLRPSNEGGDMSVIAPHLLLKMGSKAIVYWNGERFRDMAGWRATGHGEHSIFLDPKWVDPIAYDFRLSPDSPNIGAGRDGVDIGAFPVAPPTP